MNKYLRAFVIGSSLPVFVLYFIGVMNISTKSRNYSYETYSLLAPLYFGVMNVVSLFIAELYGWDLKKRLIITGLISPIIVFTAAYMFKSYNFSVSNNNLAKYFMLILVAHFITFTVIIYFLEQHI